MKNRKESLMPNGIPRYIRCYDNQGESFDRYTVVFTGRYKHKTNGEFMFLGMSHNPFHPQGYGQHGGCEYHIDIPKYSHLGKKISFNDLPEDCKQLVIQDYKYIWDIED